MQIQMPMRSIPTPSTGSTSTTTVICSRTSRSATCFRSRKTASRLSACFWPKAPSPALSKPSGRRSSFGPRPNIVKAGDYTFFAGSRSDAFFFDFDGIKNLFDIRGKRNFTEPHLTGKSPWTGVDSNTEANVFSMVVELPTSELAPKPEMHIWGRCSVRENGKLIHADRAGHPSVSSFFNTDDTKLEYNASEPVNDRGRWLEQFVHLMGHTGDYSREEAIAEIDRERTLPDVLSFDPSKPAKYPNGRVFTDDVIDYRLAFLTKGECPPTGLKPHADILNAFPYIGTPHQK
jgi:hypothetical protein